MINYGVLSDYELSTLAGRVKNAMQDVDTAASFPDADPDAAALSLLVEDFIARHEVASRGGSTLEVSQKNESREVLLHGLRKLASYANGIALGRTSLLLSTGLTLVSSQRPSQLPGVTARVQLRDGRISGQMRLDFQSVKGAWEYEVEVGSSLVDEGEISWDHTQHTTSSRANVLTGIVPGLRYHVRVRARNGRGLGDWSEPAILIGR